jgi:hypothetical protein
MFKFNEHKLVTMNFGFKLYEKNQIKIDNKFLETKETCKYLGLWLDENNDGNDMIIERFNDVIRSYKKLFVVE